jgi:hypothetical protein
MAEDDTVSLLKSEHAGLERAITKELARPYPNEETLAELKRQKLRIKDQLLKLHAASR